MFKERVNRIFSFFSAVSLLVNTFVAPISLYMQTAPTALAVKPEVVTFCHVAGQADDPANYVDLTLPWNAVYGQAGHFNENGTTQAGHEEDYFGTCITPTPTPTEELTPTPTEEPTATPTEIPIETPTP